MDTFQALNKLPGSGEFTPTGQLPYSWRKEKTIESSFADVKELHGLRTARITGPPGMRKQSFLSAAVQNIE
jgi:hypothetical protein